MRARAFRRLRGAGVPDLRRRLVRTAVLAATCGAAGAVHAAPADDTPGSFVRAVYARYAAHGPGVPTMRPGGSTVYAPVLLDAFARAAASAPAGDIGPIDYDPLCACQDFDDLKLESVEVSSGAAGRAMAKVAFADTGTHRRLTLSLVHTPAGWRVDDVGVPGRKTVAATLRAAMSLKRR